jgi:hypothetical protein
MAEEELVVSVKMGDVINLGMSRAEFTNMSLLKRKEMIAEHLVNKLPDTTHSLQEMLVSQWIDSHEVLEVRNERAHRCDNCGAEWSDEQLERKWPDIPDLSERTEPGYKVPSGECPDPDCGALCYPLESYTEENLVRDLELLLKESFHRNDGGDSQVYHDYERHPHGFGSDGNARTERVTFYVETGRWGGMAVHNEPDGETTYEVDCESDGTLRDAIKKLNDDQKTQKAKRKDGDS